MKVETLGRVKIIVNGEETRLDEIPAVRYAFGNEAWLIGKENGEQDFNVVLAETIKHNRTELKRSLHIIELDATFGSATDAVINYIRQFCGNIAIFMYVDFTGEYDLSFVSEVESIKGVFQSGLVDRIMIRESRTANLDAMGVRNAIKYVASTVGDKKAEKIAMCDSPIGCSIGMSCLPAAVCRDLAAKYGDDIDMVLPSQNHEGMLRSSDRACNCIGFVEVAEIKPCPVKETKAKAGSSTKKTSGEKDMAEKENKIPKKKSLGKKVMLKW